MDRSYEEPQSHKVRFHILSNHELILILDGFLLLSYLPATVGKQDSLTILEMEVSLQPGLIIIHGHTPKIDKC